MTDVIDLTYYVGAQEFEYVLETGLKPECLQNKNLTLFDIDGVNKVKQELFHWYRDDAAGKVHLWFMQIPIDLKDQFVNSNEGVVVRLTDTVTGATREAQIRVFIEEASTLACPPVSDLVESIDLSYTIGAQELSYTLETGIKPECLANKNLTLFDIDGVNKVKQEFFHW